jgi:hypothetical protein
MISLAKKKDQSIERRKSFTHFEVDDRSAIQAYLNQ